MKTNNCKKFLGIVALLSGVATSVHAITIGDTVEVGETGELGGIPFSVDFGSVSYVSDLSNGALRFNGSASSASTSISTQNLSIVGDTEIAFDWSVMDLSDRNDFSFYQIEGLDVGISTFHDGIGMGNSSGTVSRFISTGEYVLRIQSAVAFNPDLYRLTVGNLRIRSLASPDNPDTGTPPSNGVSEVPDSSLGFLGISVMLALLGARGWFGTRPASS